jgi:hypothetical protein
MTYAAHSTDFPGYLDDQTRTRAGAKQPGVLRRLFDAFTASRRREADREIARFLARSGGRFTDDLERELMHRVTTRDWNVRR